MDTILKNQILSDLDIMRKDVEVGFYNFLNCEDYIKELNKILAKVGQLLKGYDYKFNPDPTDFNN